MTRFPIAQVWRLSVLSQLGLLSACSGEVGTKEDPESETPFDPGTLSKVVGEGGYETGRSTYENQAFEFRTSAPVCSNMPVDDPRLADLGSGGNECATGADCTEKEHGYCSVTVGQILQPYCAYGCETDSDCAATELCECGSDVGVCTPAECRSSSDCDGARCLRIVEQDACSDGFGPRTYYKCESKADACVVDSDCAAPKVCLTKDGARSCAERTLCGIGRPFLIDNEARLADSVERRDWLLDIEVNLAQLLESLSPQKRERLSGGWRKIALMEHASIAAFARFQLELLSLGAPAALVEATNQALIDETLHARTAFALTSLFSGQAEGPGPLEISGALGGEGLEEIALMVLLEGCIGETTAAMEARWAADHSADPTLRELLNDIARDEKRHSDLAWQFIAWATLGRPHLTSQLLSRALEEARNQRGIAGSEHKDEWISAYGLVPERVRDELRVLALEDIVVPCLAALQRHAA